MQQGTKKYAKKKRTVRIFAVLKLGPYPNPQPIWYDDKRVLIDEEM
jgi:hypothetical protein